MTFLWPLNFEPKYVFDRFSEPPQGGMHRDIIMYRKEHVPTEMMQMRFSRALKSKTKQSINTLQEILKINRLSTNELSGNLNSISYSKIFKGSTLEVPFSLGRTIRGVAFEEYELDPVSFCLSRQDMYNFDQEMFAKDFNNICVSENNKQVKDFYKQYKQKIFWIFGLGDCLPLGG